MTSSADTGIVFNMQPYSVHDGPGIRTLVFLKGCPLRCTWCSNPESQSGKLEIGYNKNKCLGCNRCVQACTEKALLLTEAGVALHRDSCTLCGLCTEACPSKAMILYGASMTANEVLDKVEQDSAFYARSGGGMTISGGEAFAQFPFLMSLLQEANRRAIHTAIETCGFTSEENFLEAAALLDYLLFDIKHLDDTKLKQYTGQDGVLIRKNIENVRKKFPALPVHIRTPIIPGFNDNPKSIELMVQYAKDLGAVNYEILAYHRMGAQKYTYLGREFSMQEAQLDEKLFSQLQQIVYKFFPEDNN